jgi:hypothetical protein
LEDPVCAISGNGARGRIQEVAVWYQNPIAQEKLVRIDIRNVSSVEQVKPFRNYLDPCSFARFKDPRESQIELIELRAPNRIAPRERTAIGAPIAVIVQVPANRPAESSSGSSIEDAADRVAVKYGSGQPAA